jgi:tetratricopeptide (TPR) repeat protein
MTAADDPRPLCFVLMPFGTKPDQGSNTMINFDAIYEKVIKPAIEDTGLKAIRADEEKFGGIIHKLMFERLLICDFAVADLTTANANVYYELGIRHAMRPWSTVLIYAGGVRLPFDLGPVRALPYHLDGAGNASDPEADRASLAASLRAARKARSEVTDSPLYQLLEELPEPDVRHLKPDAYLEQFAYSNALRERLAQARPRGVDAVRAIRAELGDLGDYESGVLIDLLLAFRDLEAWPDMVALVEEMPAEVARATPVREQYGLALNRIGQGEKAERVLKTLIESSGSSSETYGILGRVYKDRYEAALKAGRVIAAAGLLDKAIATYVKGFESDWRDAYPGINAVQLMELSHPPDLRQAELLPVVTYSVKRRIESKQPDYWDYATLLELALLNTDEQAAMDALSKALAADPLPWQARSTLATVLRLRRARQERGTPLPDWVAEVEQGLTEAS